MLSAYVLIQTEVGKAGQVAQAIGGIDGVQRAEDVAGPYDVIARVQAPGMDELGRLVVARIQAVDGVTPHPDLHDDPPLTPGGTTAIQRWI
jgi:DNA-binding Lrp family transcriptional regulator